MYFVQSENLASPKCEATLKSAFFNMLRRLEEQDHNNLFKVKILLSRMRKQDCKYFFNKAFLQSMKRSTQM